MMQINFQDGGHLYYDYTQQYNTMRILPNLLVLVQAPATRATQTLDYEEAGSLPFPLLLLLLEERLLIVLHGEDVAKMLSAQ